MRWNGPSALRISGVSTSVGRPHSTLQPSRVVGLKPACLNDCLTGLLALPM
jgi:hypothetical protein